MEASCRRHVLFLTHHPPLEGELSFDRGFIPRRLTPPRLPESHARWDEVADQLPDLLLSSRAQRVLERMSRLSAAPEALPDAALTRAAVILSALGHAYWRFGPTRFFPRRITQVSTALPPSILEPWREVARRLGRYRPERPFQNFYDLFLSNYRLRDGIAADAPRTIENLDVLVSSFRNEAERVFYMSFVEMHHHLTPMIGAICDIEDAIAADDAGAVVSALARIEAGLGKATSVWNKISARPGSRVFCDPILWSKTAAILGVPPDGAPQGATSGACAPMLYVMDALLARENYESRYGRFMVDQAQDLVASSIRAFSDSVRRVPLPAYVDARRDSGEGRALRDALDAVVAAYCGDHGWLGRHASKVFNYLCISTITGRNASVSGDERYFSRQTWVEASAELHESRSERSPASSARAGGGCPFGHSHADSASTTESASRTGSASRAGSVPKPAEAPSAPSRSVRDGVRAESARLAPGLPEYSLIEVARHHADADLWLVIDDFVYDVSPFLAKHPGGVAILQAYAGQDVSDVFWGQSVHHSRAVPALLERYRIGRSKSAESAKDAPELYGALAMLIRCHQSSRMQFEHSMGGALGLKLLSDENAHMLLLEENLPGVFDLLEPGSWEEIAAGNAARRVRENAQRLGRELDLGGPLSLETAERIRDRCQTLREADLTLTGRLLELLFDAITDATERPSTDRRRGLVAAMQRELTSYFERL